MDTTTKTDLALGFSAGLALAGGVALLVFGSTNQLGNFGGHKWQTITGSSIIIGEAALGIIAGLYLILERKYCPSEEEAQTLLSKDERNLIWIEASNKEGERLIYAKRENNYVSLVDQTDESFAVKEHLRTRYTKISFIEYLVMHKIPSALNRN